MQDIFLLFQLRIEAKNFHNYFALCLCEFDNFIVSEIIENQQLLLDFFIHLIFIDHSMIIKVDDPCKFLEGVKNYLYQSIFLIPKIVAAFVLSWDTIKVLNKSVKVEFFLQNLTFPLKLENFHLFGRCKNFDEQSVFLFGFSHLIYLSIDSLNAFHERVEMSNCQGFEIIPSSSENEVVVGYVHLCHLNPILQNTFSQDGKIIKINYHCRIINCNCSLGF